MKEVSSTEPPRAVVFQHGGRATLEQSAPSKEIFEGKTIWEGAVHVFDFTGNPSGRSRRQWGRCARLFWQSGG